MAEFIDQNRELVAAIVGGIIATIGSVATIITSNYLKESGKLIVTLSSSDIYLRGSDRYGGVVAVVSPNDAEGLSVKLGIDFYNSSEVPKSLRKPLIELRPISGKETFLLAPRIYTPEKSVHLPYRDLDVINFEAKKLIHMEIYGGVGREKVPLLLGKNTISFVALYPDGRKFRVQLGRTEIVRPTSLLPEQQGF